MKRDREPWDEPSGMPPWVLALAIALGCVATLFSQTTMPPPAPLMEGWASDGEVWTWQTFRCTTRYPASWVQAPKTITQVAWRGNSTYAYTYDRLPGLMILRVGPWFGDTSVAWTPRAPSFAANIDPPTMVITKPWEPQPFTFVVPLVTPVYIIQGGVEIDVIFSGPWDPVWGNRATYWVDALSSPDTSPSLGDQWVDTVPPNLGCAGWVSETRADRVPGKLTMECRDTSLPNAPAILAIGTVPAILGCSHVAATVFLPTVTDAGAWLQYHFTQPAADFTWTWQPWIYDATRQPDQCLGSGHYATWRYGDPWQCQTAYAYQSTASQPAHSIPGSVWAVELR